MKRKKIIVDTALAALFCTLICVGAFIKIPIPNLPMTMQVFFVLLSGLVLEPKVAFLSAFSYLFLGLMGLPIFTGGGGVGYLLIPTFGFIIGFVFASTAISFIIKYSKRQGFWWFILFSFIGVVIIYLVGIPYFKIITNINTGQNKSFYALFGSLLIPFIPKEIISLTLASLVAFKLRPLFKKLN